MPRVRLLARMNVAGGHHERGEEVDVPGDVASNLTQLGCAVVVRGGRPATPERASRTEKATRRRREVT